MTQTSAIAGGLVVAFVVFITVKGQLPCYLQVLGISNAGGASCPSNVTPSPTATAPAQGAGFIGGGGGSSIGISLPPINIGLPGLGGDSSGPGFGFGLGGGFGSGFGGFGGGLGDPTAGLGPGANPGDLGGTGHIGVGVF